MAAIRVVTRVADCDDVVANSNKVPSALLPARLDHLSFGVSGTPALNAATQPIFLDRAVTCSGITAACGTAPSGSPATLTLQTSTDGTTWTNLTSGAVSISASAYSGTAACTTSIAANTYVRGKFTAVNSVADMTATLFIAY